MINRLKTEIETKMWQRLKNETGGKAKSST